MATNAPIIDVDQKVIITPVLLNDRGEQLDWNVAVSNYSAVCLWEDLSNASPFGSFIILSNGVAKFNPIAIGSFTVKCVVTYTDPSTLITDFVSGVLLITVPTEDVHDITVLYKPYKVPVSSNDNNRLTKDDTGALFVPEVTTDLVDVYNTAKL